MMRSPVASSKISRLGWLALLWSLSASSLLAFAPVGTRQEAVEVVKVGQEMTVAGRVTHSSLFETQGAGVLGPLAVAPGVCLIALTLAYATRSGFPFGVSSIVLLFGCVLGAASIGLFFVPAAALLAFAAGRTPRRFKSDV